MADVKVPALPEEYEAMFNDTVKDIKEIVMKIRGNNIGRNGIKNIKHTVILDEKKSKFSVPGYNISSGGGGGGRLRETVDMIVPANKAGLIIGSHGDNLRRIEKMSQVKMQFDQQWQGGENERRIVITGFPEDIEEARRLIVEKITEEKEFYKSRNNYETTQIMIQNSKIGLIIGRGGETVKDLQDRSGAKIFVNQDTKYDANNSNSYEKAVTISGDPEAVKLAQSMINDILNGGPPGSYSSLTGGRPTLTVQIPEATIGSVMGKRAEILKSIISASGGIKIFIEHANIPGTQNREVQFTGPMEHCNYAAYLVQERVNAYYNGTSGGNGSGSGETYSSYGSVAATNEAYAAYSDPSASAINNPSAAGYDYSQYYAAQAPGMEMDPAAVAAYYAQYYASYDPNSQYNYNTTEASHDPTENNS